MENKYKEESINNVFKLLSDDCSLWFLGLCLASNDIRSFQKQKNNCSDEEETYHFSITLSILRELAKLISTAENVGIKKYFSSNTEDLFSELEQELKSFEEDSLTKGVLKPIRDTTFHYDFSKNNDKENLLPFLEDLRKESELQVKVNPEDISILRQTYYFADIFRHKFHFSLLTEKLIGKLTTVTCDVIALADSLLADLSNNKPS